MGEIVRKWPFESYEYASFDLTIKEPPLVGDSLGFKTWGSSYLLALMLDGFAASSLSHLLNESRDSPFVPVVELGSGTGLLGLAAAAIWQTHVVLSDLPTIMPNLMENIDRNRKIVESLGGSLDAGALTWGGDVDETDQDLFQNKHLFKVSLQSFTTMMSVS